ncbi:hypothetical protein A9W95_24400 [Mycobacterium sp. 1423905.2]|nr:hypothetical protein A9W95_24400 [Mycobacterium sp. 1423905.2]
MLSIDHPGDHKTGNDEEDVNTDESTWHREPAVVGDDQKDRYCAEPLDVEAPIIAWSTALGPRHTFHGNHAEPD